MWQKKFATLFRIWSLHIQTYTIYIIYIWNRCKRKFTCIVIVCNFQCQPLALSLTHSFYGLVIYLNEWMKKNFLFPVCIWLNDSNNNNILSLSLFFSNFFFMSQFYFHLQQSMLMIQFLVDDDDDIYLERPSWPLPHYFQW